MNGARLSIWPPLPPSVYRQTRVRRPPFPLEEPHCRLFALARHGLWRGVQALGLGPGDKILAPAYHHGSEIEALRRAGLACVFYGGTETLEPDERQLAALLDPRVKALHLTHYFGFPQDVPRWRAWCDERELLLIEDAAQALLSTRRGRPVGAFGDLAVFCLYKTFGLPDGAAAIARAPLASPSAKPRLGLTGILGRHGAWLAQRWPGPALGRPVREGARPYSPERDFALGNPDTPPAALTARLLPRALDPTAADRRRENYRALLDELAALTPPPFATLPDGASPFVFPIQTRSRASLLAALARRGIAAASIWSAPHPSLPADAFPHEQALRSTVVGLPVHQELRRADIRRIARVVRECSATGRQ